MNRDAWRPSRRQFVHVGGGLIAGALAGSSLLRQRASAADADRYELSLHQYSLKPLFDSGRLSTADYPRFVKETFGFSNVEFAVEFCEDLKADPAKADAIRQRSEELGIKHRALLGGAEPALDAEDSATRQAALEDHLRWAKVAERLGCDFFRVRASTEGDPEEQLEHAAAGIGRLCEALDDSPVRVLVENIAGHSRDARWLVRLVERIGPERIGLIADFGNFEGDIYEGMRRLVPHARSVCTKSWEFDAAGEETTIDFGRMMQLIDDSGFRGCIAIEYLGEEPVEGVRKTADLINRNR